MRWIWRSLLAVVAAPLIWLATALALGAVPTGGRQFDPFGTAVWVVSNGYHAGLVLPVAANGIDWRDSFPVEHFPSEIRGYPVIAFGWGERDVYMNTPRITDLDPLDGARAIFALSTSVAHVQYGFPPADSHYSRRLLLSPDRYRTLAAYIRATFRDERTGRPIAIAGKSFSATDAFYEAKGRYSFLYTCNEWVGQGLRRIDAPSAPWTPFAYQVLAHLE